MCCGLVNKKKYLLNLRTVLKNQFKELVELIQEKKVPEIVIEDNIENIKYVIYPEARGVGISNQNKESYCCK